MHNWISVKESLPTTAKRMLCKNEKGFVFIAQYTKGHELDYEDWDYDGEYDPVEEKDGALYLKEDWYESQEQYSDEYDERWFKRNVAFWTLLPE